MIQFIILLKYDFVFRTLGANELLEILWKQSNDRSLANDMFRSTSGYNLMNTDHTIRETLPTCTALC